ncbi:MAG: ribbon-helix-helix protein, CopG family [Candidatus Gastranaerophilales bacterium]|jgi:metal-responsive CopG/Arc/MetJ family transcriptional regulator|nr:ribbon-helix-helix protein, CopG family [Candidatus Gastranaerophilales bacterium]
MARVLISMSDDFLSRIDEMADDEQRTRSELVREALRTYMKRNRNINIKKASQNAEMLENLLD